ncbi:MAG: carboxypeptidase-like regulatory domain-containing protein, partial [Planctomycetia bacterium]
EFRIVPPEKGPWHISVEADGFARTTTEAVDASARASNEPLVIELWRGATLEGTVRHPGGDPATDIWVLVTNGVPPASFTRTDAAGGYRLEQLSPGQQWVRATALQPGSLPTVFTSGGSGREPEAPLCTLAAGETRRLDLIVEAPAVVLVRVSSELPIIPQEFYGMGVLEREARSTPDMLEARWKAELRTLEFRFSAAGKTKLQVNLSNEMALTHELELSPGQTEVTLDVRGGPVEIVAAPGSTLPPTVVLRALCQSSGGERWVGNFSTATKDNGARCDWIPYGELTLISPETPSPRSFEHRAGSTLRIEW